MIDLEKVLIAFAIVITIAYVILSFIAFNHVSQEKKSKISGGLLALTLWWPFYDLYDEYGKKINAYGKLLLPSAAIVYVLLILL